ncbi:THAP domain-containing protein 11-like [Sycon ciliatum]|uniref:THAP domain-containing protein 11-like n=1 Tax=Sycon ciliatum TaxID=27933 RepID=UPI0020AA7F25|eukprot:scpid76719/ scgid8907/ 
MDLMVMLLGTAVTTCSVTGCGSRQSKQCGKGFFRIPTNMTLARRQLWIKALDRSKLANGEPWAPKSGDRVCGDHFSSGRPSTDPANEDYIPNQKLNASDHPRKPRSQRAMHRAKSCTRSSLAKKQRTTAAKTSTAATSEAALPLLELSQDSPETMDKVATEEEARLEARSRKAAVRHDHNYLYNGGENPLKQRSGWRDQQQTVSASAGHHGHRRSTVPEVAPRHSTTLTVLGPVQEAMTAEVGVNTDISIPATSGMVMVEKEKYELFLAQHSTARTGIAVIKW